MELSISCDASIDAVLSRWDIVALGVSVWIEKSAGDLSQYVSPVANTDLAASDNTMNAQKLAKIP